MWLYSGVADDEDEDEFVFDVTIVIAIDYLVIRM